MTRASRTRRRRLAVLGGKPRFAEPLHLTRPRSPEEPAVLERLAGVLRSGWLTNDGVLAQQLEERLRHRLGTAYALAFCNATTGLMTALRALDLDGEVITTPFTFPATVQAIAWAGLTPVFADVDPATFNLDPRAAEAVAGGRSAALLPVHLYGNPCDVEALARLATGRGLALLYDASHAFGVEARGRPIGCWGDLSVFSFHATKVFHTAEGGAVAAASERLLARLRALRNFGMADEDHVVGVGLNGKMSDLHAAVGLSVLDLVDDEIRRRAAVAARYREHLAGVAGLGFQTAAPESLPNHAYFVLTVDEADFGVSRDTLHHALQAEGVRSRRYFHLLCSEIEPWNRLPSAARERLPRAHALASRVICLPLHGGMTADDAEAVAEVVLEVRDAAPLLGTAPHPSQRSER